MTQFVDQIDESGLCLLSEEEPKAFRAAETCRARFLQYFHSIIFFLIPSFLTRQPAKPPNELWSLDGLRGIASFCVFTVHFTDTFCQNHNRGWGIDKDNHYLFQLPFIHAFWTASSLVACFFLISGYVLSYKPLKLIHSASSQQFLRTMSSSVFRRGIRLWVPTILATFISFLMACMGLFDYPHWVYTHHFTTASEDTPPNLGSFTKQFQDWWHGILDMTYLFRPGGTAPSYDPHLFTIPFEFQCSMLLFLITIGVARLRTPFRLGSIAVLACYCSWYQSNELVLFLVGMLLCDVDLLLRRPPSPTLPLHQVAPISPQPQERLRRLRIVWLLSFVAGFYLMGMPSWDPLVTPGYMTLMSLHNNWFRWQTLGCTLLVVAVRNSQDLEALFRNRLVQYLGSISFALYLVHGNVRRTVSYALMPGLYALTNARESKAGFAVLVAVNAVVTYSVAIWISDVWWRAVDMPSVRLARWLEEKICGNGES